jgi:hypothetical protein
MSAYSHAVAVGIGTSDQALARAAEVLASGDGVVLLEGHVALRAADRPRLPHAWLVVEDRGTGTAELWPAP